MRSPLFPHKRAPRTQNRDNTTGRPCTELWSQQAPCPASWQSLVATHRPGLAADITPPLPAAGAGGGSGGAPGCHELEEHGTHHTAGTGRRSACPASLLEAVAANRPRERDVGRRSIGSWRRHADESLLDIYSRSCLSWEEEARYNLLPLQYHHH